MKLYQFALSPNCQKVVALALEVGVSLDRVSVDVFRGGLRTPEMLAKNPNAKVPILEDDDFVLWESNAMLPYLASKAERDDLAPVKPRERADVDRWLAWHNAHFAPAIRKVAYERIVKRLAGLGAPDEAAVREGAEQFEIVAAVLDRCLHGKEYLSGRLTIADFALAPYAAATESCGLDLARFSRANAWLGRMLARDSLRQTLALAREAA